MPVPTDVQRLEERLARAERALRTIVGAAVAAVLICLGIATVRSQSASPPTVRAGSFELLDSSGRVRGRLSMKVWPSESTPEEALELFDEQGSATVRLTGGTSGRSGPTLSLFKGDTTIQANVIDPETPSIVIMHRNAKALTVDFSAGRGALALNGASGGRVMLDASLPSVSAKDQDGFEVDMGSAAISTPSTGAKTTTSAASVMLFDKSGRVLWSTPR